MTSNQKQHRQPQKRWRSLVKTGRGCPSLVGGRPAKSVAGNGRVGSNPTPRAILFVQGIAIFLACF